MLFSKGIGPGVDLVLGETCPRGENSKKEKREKEKENRSAV